MVQQPDLVRYVSYALVQLALRLQPPVVSDLCSGLLGLAFEHLSLVRDLILQAGPPAGTQSSPG